MKYETEFKKEHREHPSFPDATIARIVSDHHKRSERKTICEKLEEQCKR